jgi:hypothetical protein
MLHVPIFHEDSSGGGRMRSIAFIWVVALISAALAQGASAQEKIQLAQSSTVTNCMMNCN